MRGGRKHRCDKRLFHFRHPVTIELQEFFIPNSPSPVKIRIAIVIRVLIIFGTTKIFLETHGTGKSLETHWTVHRAMEKSRWISLVFGQLTSNAGYIIQSRRSQKERFYKAWYRRQYRRHPINTLAAIAIWILKSQTLCQQWINKRSITLVSPVFQLRIQWAYMLFTESLPDNYHYIHRAESSWIGREMHWRISCNSFCLRKIIRNDKRRFPQRAEQREWCI